MQDSVKKLYATLEKDQQFHGEERYFLNLILYNKSLTPIIITGLAMLMNITSQWLHS